MNKAAVAMVVIMTILITVAVGASFVTNHLSDLTDFSTQNQDRSSCNAWNRQADSPGDTAAQKYVNNGCTTITGSMEFSGAFEGPDSHRLAGITLRDWNIGPYYGHKHQYNYSINFSRLDGQEYLREFESLSNEGEFEHRDDYSYQVDFHIRHPVSSPSNELDWRSIQEGDETGNQCTGELCSFQNNFTFSTEGNLSNDMLDCSDEDGNQSDFLQEIVVEVYDDDSFDNSDKIGEVAVQNQSMTLNDPLGSPCWQEDSPSIFDGGKLLVMDSVLTETLFDRDQQEEVNAEIDISGYSEDELDSLQLFLTHDRGAIEIGSTQTVSSCGARCVIEDTVVLDDEALLPSCDRRFAVSQRTVNTVLEVTTPEEATNYTIDSSFVNDPGSGSVCWLL